MWLNQLPNIHILRRNPTSRWVDFKTTHQLDGCTQNLHTPIHYLGPIKTLHAFPIMLSIQPTFDSLTPLPSLKVFPQCLCPQPTKQSRHPKLQSKKKRKLSSDALTWCNQNVRCKARDTTWRLQAHELSIICEGRYQGWEEIENSMASYFAHWEVGTRMHNPAYPISTATCQGNKINTWEHLKIHRDKKRAESTQWSKSPSANWRKLALLQWFGLQQYRELFSPDPNLSTYYDHDTKTPCSAA
jgi:hypothetical protein